MRRFTVTALAIALTATSVLAQEARTAKDSEGKAFLQTPAAMTLYVFDGDDQKGGGSNCYEQCATAWPPFATAGEAQPAGDWTIVKRTDGRQQWAYKGRPLYTFAKDTAAGQRNGNSFNGNKWHVAQP